MAARKLLIRHPAQHAVSLKSRNYARNSSTAQSVGSLITSQLVNIPFLEYISNETTEICFFQPHAKTFSTRLARHSELDQ